MLYHFLLPFNMKYFLSFDFTAVVAIFATSEPASGSVIAMHILFFPLMISGTKRFCSSRLPNFIIGGNPKAKPIVMAPLGPLVPIRAICEHQYLFRRQDQCHSLHLYKSTYVSNQKSSTFRPPGKCVMPAALSRSTGRGGEKFGTRNPAEANFWYRSSSRVRMV